MTTEQEFIKCFKLSRYSYVCKFKGNTVWFHTWDIQRMINFIKKGWKVVKVEKLPDPPITSEIVLKLIAICSSLFPISFAMERGADDVKENVLQSCIWATKQKDLKDIIQDQVRECF